MLRLARAEGHYREALRYDEHYARALTRLGRVLHLSDHLPEAKTYLEQAVRDAKLPGDQYLASLFIGALQFEQNDLSAARESYERALAIIPASQTAMVALGHLEIMAGRPDRAQFLARRFTETPAEPWWGYKDGSFDMIGLEALRARVVRR
jgi:Tfp pilus assembly protein PilF